MMDSTDRPFGTHDPEERICAYCGDIYESHHGLQQYCPEKFGKKHYCMYEQKKMMNEKKLAEAAEKLNKAGLNVFSPIDPTEKNIGIFAELLGPFGQKTVSNEILDTMGYSAPHFTARVPKSGTNDFLLVVGPYTIDWVGENGDILTFKITKS